MRDNNGGRKEYGEVNHISRKSAFSGKGCHPKDWTCVIIGRSTRVEEGLIYCIAHLLYFLQVALPTEVLRGTRAGTHLHPRHALFHTGKETV